MSFLRDIIVKEFLIGKLSRYTIDRIRNDQIYIDGYSGITIRDLNIRPSRYISRCKIDEVHIDMLSYHITIKSVDIGISTTTNTTNTVTGPSMATTTTTTTNTANTVTGPSMATTTTNTANTVTGPSMATTSIFPSDYISLTDIVSVVTDDVRPPDVVMDIVNRLINALCDNLNVVVEKAVVSLYDRTISIDRILITSTRLVLTYGQYTINVDINHNNRYISVDINNHDIDIGDISSILSGYTGNTDNIPVIDYIVEVKSGSITATYGHNTTLTVYTPKVHLPNIESNKVVVWNNRYIVTLHSVILSIDIGMVRINNIDIHQVDHRPICQIDKVTAIYHRHRHSVITNVDSRYLNYDGYLFSVSEVIPSVHISPDIEIHIDKLIIDNVDIRDFNRYGTDSGSNITSIPSTSITIHNVDITCKYQGIYYRITTNNTSKISMVDYMVYIESKDINVNQSARVGSIMVYILDHKVYIITKDSTIYLRSSLIPTTSSIYDGVDIIVTYIGYNTVMYYDNLRLILDEIKVFSRAYTVNIVGSGYRLDIVVPDYTLLTGLETLEMSYRHNVLMVSTKVKIDIDMLYFDHIGKLITYIPRYTDSCPSISGSLQVIDNYEPTVRSMVISSQSSMTVMIRNVDILCTIRSITGNGSIDIHLTGISCDITPSIYKISVGDIVIEDRVLTSTWKYILCRDGYNQQVVREDILKLRVYVNGNNIGLAIEEVKPLRLFIDQDTIDCIIGSYTTSITTYRWNFSYLIISNIRLCIDYKSRLRSISIRDVYIDLPSLKIYNIPATDVVSYLIKTWYPEIRSKIPLQILFKINGVPYLISRFTQSLISAVIVIPYGNPIDSLKSIISESVGVLGELSLTASNILDRTQMLLSEDVVDGEYRQQCISKFSKQRSNLNDMMKDIYYVIHRELNDLKVTLIEIPKYEYNNNGVYSCIQQVVKGIPLVIIKPVLGTTEGIGRMLLTIRNILDEKTKTDMDRKYK